MINAIADPICLRAHVEGGSGARRAPSCFYVLPTSSGDVAAQLYATVSLDYVLPGGEVTFVESGGGDPWAPSPPVIDGLRGVSLLPIWQRAADQFVARVAQDLDEDCSDPAGGVSLCNQAREVCQRIASVLAGSVALQPGLKYASFVEEEGGTSLVLQSGLSGRRANFRVSPDASQITVVSVDAAGKTVTAPVFLRDTATLRRFAEWVSKRD